MGRVVINVTDQWLEEKLAENVPGLPEDAIIVSVGKVNNDLLTSTFTVVFETSQVERGYEGQMAPALSRVYSE